MTEHCQREQRRLREQGGYGVARVYGSGRRGTAFDFALDHDAQHVSRVRRRPGDRYFLSQCSRYGVSIQVCSAACGVQGLPVTASRMAVMTLMPCLRTVEM